MSRWFFIGTAAFAAVFGALAWRMAQSSSSEAVFESKSKPSQVAPLCPWREPEADLKRFFPKANRYQVETRILSAFRLELAERLGRVPTGDENTLRLYRIYEEQTPVGTVMTRRVKGQYGAIELVVAVDPEQRLRGLRLQRLREPETVASALQDANWQQAFARQSAASSSKVGLDLPDIPAEARASAEAIAEGVKSLLVLLATSEENASPKPHSPHHSQATMAARFLVLAAAHRP